MTIKGLGFTGATGVTIGGVSANNLIANDTTIYALTPSGSPGVASVVVTTPSGSNVDNALFTNIASPVVSSITPSGGPQQGGRLSARVPVDVSSGDVRNVQVRMTPPLEVTGKIAPEKADSSLNLTQVRLNFTSTLPAGIGGGRGGQQGRIDIATDGKFTTQLDADTYNVELQNAPAGYYLKAVKLSGREVPDNILELTFNGSALDIVLAKDAGNITGTVQRSNGDPVQSARVTAVPANGSNRRDLYKSATSGADGTFTLSTLPPGSYKLYAWEEVEQNAWMDPEFRRPFEALGTNATVKDGAGPNVTLKVIGREQVAAIQ